MNDENTNHGQPLDAQELKRKGFTLDSHGDYVNVEGKRIDPQTGYITARAASGVRDQTLTEAEKKDVLNKDPMRGGGASGFDSNR